MVPFGFLIIGLGFRVEGLRFRVLGCPKRGHSALWVPRVQPTMPLQQGDCKAAKADRAAKGSQRKKWSHLGISEHWIVPFWGFLEHGVRAEQFRGISASGVRVLGIKGSFQFWIPVLGTKATCLTSMHATSARQTPSNDFPSGKLLRGVVPCGSPSSSANLADCMVLRLKHLLSVSSVLRKGHGHQLHKLL